MTTRRQLLGEATATLAAAGVGAPRVDAELLLARVLGVGRPRLVLADDPDAGQVAAFHRLLRRRAGREPLQHILGRAPFRHLDLAVGSGVFVPRPETELLVDAVLSRLPDGATVVDLGAGCGALALAVAHERPDVSVIAVERAEAALPWLHRNAAERARAGDGAVDVRAGDIRDPTLLADVAGRVDAVLCNPPYVPDGTAVGPEVAHDPADAVFAGPDGLDLIASVSRSAARLLRQGGVLAVEHDDTQGGSVPARLRAGGTWLEVTDHVDLTGRPRFVTALRGPISSA